MGRDRLRIMVCPHELAMGGSQMNAIELAAQAQRDGHQVMVFAPEGPLSQRVAQLGLEQVISPVATRLSLRWMRELGQLAVRWNTSCEGMIYPRKLLVMNTSQVSTEYSHTSTLRCMLSCGVVSSSQR